MFSRTNHGLSNIHLFYNTDFIVYCEGESFDDESSSIDEKYWEKIFMASGKSVAAKSLGSKSNVLRMANSIIQDGVSNSLVAIDKDYDELIGTKIDDPRIVYTYGYSWESDVVSDIDICSVVLLFATTNSYKKIEKDFQDFFNRQSKELRRIFALDLKYINHPSSLFDRKKPASIISIGSTTEPHIKRDLLLNKAKSLGKFQSSSLPRHVYVNACGIRYFFGKSVSVLIYHWFIFRCKRFRNSRKTYYDTFMEILVNSLSLANMNSARNRYYMNCLAKI